MSEQGIQINWFGAAGSALGAVTSAVVLSTLGAAGTLIGAAVGSLLITVGGSFYSHSLRRTKERVVEHVVAAPGKTRRSNGAPTGPESSEVEVTRISDASEIVDASEPDDHSELDDDAPSGGRFGQVLRDLPWKRIVATAVGLFAVAMAVILAFELWAGRPVSSFTGGSTGTSSGTSIPGFDPRSGDSGTDIDEQDPQEQDQQDQPDQQDPQDQAPQDEQPAPPEEPVAPDAPADPPADQ